MRIVVLHADAGTSDIANLVEEKPVDKDRKDDMILNLWKE